MSALSSDAPSVLGAKTWGGRTRLERFWSKVDRRGPNECWLWTASCTDNGYGHLGDWRKPSREGGHPRPARAHVLSWAIAHDRWPDAGMVVRHAFVNPPCVNPAHLLIGTHADNMRDARERRRNPRWAAADDKTAALASEVARLTPQRMQILRALQRHPQPTLEDIAKERGVSRQAVEQSIVLMEAAGLVRRQKFVVMADLDAATGKFIRIHSSNGIAREEAESDEPHVPGPINLPPPTKFATPRQVEFMCRVLALSKDGRPPTVREVMLAMGFSSTNAVADYFRVLEKKGLIHPMDLGGARRVMRLTEHGRSVLGLPSPALTDLAVTP